MQRLAWRMFTALTVAALFAPSAGQAGHHEKQKPLPGAYKGKLFGKHNECGYDHKDKGPPGQLGKKVKGPKEANFSPCYVWTLKEIEETVYEVKYEEKKETIRRPVIKEIKQPVSCKVCKPFARNVLRECMVPDYGRDTRNETKEICHQTTDECGNVCESTEIVPQLITCMIKTCVPMMVPVLEWEMIAVEDVHDDKFLVREWVDEEVIVRVPVRCPKTIIRKVWTKTPYNPPCEQCVHECEAGCQAEGCVEGAVEMNLEAPPVEAAPGH